MYIKNIQPVAEHVTKLNLVPRILPAFDPENKARLMLRIKIREGVLRKHEIAISTAGMNVVRASQGRPTLVATNIRHPQDASNTSTQNHAR